MVAQVTEDEEGKTVVAADGERIGRVEQVRNGTARVDVDAEVAHSIKSAMAWDDQDQDTFKLQDSAIERITDDELRLADEL